MSTLEPQTTVTAADATKFANNAVVGYVDAAGKFQPIDATHPMPSTDVSTDPVQTYVSNSYLNVAAGTATTVVKSGAGIFASITINTKGASSNTLTVYDNTAGSGTKIATIDTTAAQVTLNFNVAFAAGLTIVSATGTGADYTVAYR